MELIRDNRKIVDRITHDHIDKFVDLLRRDKNYRYLDLLSVLCVCDGVSIADNQRYITEVWLMKGNRVSLRKTVMQGQGFESHDELVLHLGYFHMNSASTGYDHRKWT